MSEFTRLLSAAASGDGQAADQLLPLVYAELRELAAARMALERADHTLDATALVHEAYLRLVGDQQFDSRGHFFASAAEAMRRILVDHARANRTEKRGGGFERVELVDVPARAPDDELLDLDAALARLAAEHPAHAQLVTLRYFTGLTLPEAARVLAISDATADRRWAFAKAWLRAELTDTRGRSDFREKGKVRGERDAKQIALAAEEEARKRFERQAFSMQVDKIRTDSLEERDPSLTIRRRAYRYARTAAEVPDHSADLRQHLTAMALLTAQTYCPLWPRDRTDLVENVFCFPALPDAAVAQTYTGEVRVCDVLTGAPRVVLSLPGRYLSFVAVSDNGRVLATMTVEPSGRPNRSTVEQLARPAQFQFWSAADGRLLSETPVPPADQHRTEPRTFSPDGSRYLSVSNRLRPRGGFNTGADLWDPATGRLVASFAIGDPALSPDGKWVAGRHRIPTPGKEVIEARIHSAADGTEVARIVDPDGPIYWAEFTPSGRYLFTLSATHARWWSTADWKPSGGPCRLAPDPNMISVQRIDVDINDNLAPKVALQWPRRWIVRDDFAVSCWQDESSSYEPGMPIINRGGNHAMEVVRRDHPIASKIAGTPWAIDADFVLSNSGRMYSPHDGRLLFPAAGENYPAELRRMAGDGRMVVSAWPYTTPVIDTAVGKPLFSDAIGGYRLVSQPARLRAFVGGRNLTVSPGRSTTSREYGKDRFPSPTAVPGPGVAIPPDHLLRWVKLVIRGEYDANNEFQKWDETRWEAERQALARSVPPTPDYPFPGPIAADKNYWLFEEYAELLRAEWQRGLNADEALPLLERLLRIEPSADLYLTRARLRIDTGDLDGGVRDIGEAEKRLGNRCPEVWFLTRGFVEQGSTGSVTDPHSTLVAQVLSTPGLKEVTYRAAVEADRRVDALPWWEARNHRQSPVRYLVPPLAAYRFGRYDEALKLLADREFEWVGLAVAAAAVPANQWGLATALRAEVVRRNRSSVGRQKPVVDVLTLRALVLAKQGKLEEARAVWEVVRGRLNRPPTYERPILFGLQTEAQALFAPAK